MKWEVTLTESEIYIFKVDADTEEAAIDMAYELLDEPKSAAEAHHDSDGDSSACQIN